MGNQSEITKKLQALQSDCEALPNLVYGYALAVKNTDRDAGQVALGIAVDALLTEIREQFDNVSELARGAE